MWRVATAPCGWGPLPNSQASAMEMRSVPFENTESHGCRSAIEVISASSCRTTTTSLLLLIGMNASGGAIMSRGHHHTTACALTWRSSSPDSRAWHRHVCTCTKLADPQAAERAGPRCILTSVVYTYLRRWSSPSSYIGTWWWPARAGPFTEGAETRTNGPPLYGIHTVRPYRGARSGILAHEL